MIASLFLSLSSFVVLFREMTGSSLLMMYLLLLHDSHSRPLTCISSPCIFGPRNGCAGKLTYTVSMLHAGELIPASAFALRILQYLLTESALLRVPFAMACNIPGTYFFGTEHSTKMFLCVSFCALCLIPSLPFHLRPPCSG